MSIHDSDREAIDRLREFQSMMSVLRGVFFVFGTAAMLILGCQTLDWMIDVKVREKAREVLREK